MPHCDAVKIRPIILAGESSISPQVPHDTSLRFARLIHNESLFSLTLRRTSNRDRYTAPCIIGNSRHKACILEALQALNIPDATIIWETEESGTATAALIAALHETESNMLHLAMPSDCYIMDDAAFHDAVAHGQNVAAEGAIILFGMSPSCPDTHFNYILPDKQMGADICKIRVFAEKPNIILARILVSQGALWNSGIFLYRPETLCEAAHTIAQEHISQCRKTLRDARHDERYLMLLPQQHKAMGHYTFEHLLTEHTERSMVIPCSFGWQSIRSWTSLWHIAEKLQRHYILGSHMYSENMSVAALGLEDNLVIAAENTMLVASMPEMQTMHLRAVMESPGCMDITSEMDETSRQRALQTKYFILLPGCSISLQNQHSQTEHWRMVSGQAHAQCEGMEKNMLPGESLFIQQGIVYHLSNHGEQDLQIMHVQAEDRSYKKDSMKDEAVHEMA